MGNFVGRLFENKETTDVTPADVARMLSSAKSILVCARSLLVFANVLLQFSECLVCLRLFLSLSRC